MFTENEAKYRMRIRFTPIQFLKFFLALSLSSYVYSQENQAPPRPNIGIPTPPNATPSVRAPNLTPPGINPNATPAPGPAGANQIVPGLPPGGGPQLPGAPGAAPGIPGAPGIPTAAPAPAPGRLTPPAIGTQPNIPQGAAGAPGNQQGGVNVTGFPGIQGVEGNPEAGTTPPKTILINFNHVNVVEFIRFLSKISGKNFIFDEDQLQFQVTIVSEEPTTFDNIMAALLQELRIHGMSLTEQGNNIIIHQNPGVTSLPPIVSDNLPGSERTTSEIVTRLFRLNTADPDKMATILKPFTSDSAIVEVFKDTNHLIVTDINTNVDMVAQLIKSLDAPNNGLVIGQYVVRSEFIDTLIMLAQSIMLPISQDQTLLFVPHRASNSVFIVSSPFLMERTIALLQYLDTNQGVTRIFNLNDLKYNPSAAATAGGPGGAGFEPGSEWQLSNQGNWILRPTQRAGLPGQPPEGYWTVDDQGNWRFHLGTRPPGAPGAAGLAGPEGEWRLDPNGVWFFQLAPGRSISPERLTRPMRGTANLPPGNIERTQFFIYKLQYLSGDQIQIALNRIGLTLAQTTSNVDLVSTIDSIQWIQATNSLIFTGTVETLDKVRELIAEIDIPLRQVFLDMLILDTTLTDSLNFSVDWGSRFGGGNNSGSQAFLSPNSALPLGLATTGIGMTPSANALALQPGFNLGFIGQHLTHCGLRFNSIGALVSALHSRTAVNVLLNPKILTENNNTAEIFVGINTQFPTQAIANDTGTVVTQNFEYRDVGTRLRVTPIIGDNDIITLTIEEEVSNIITAATTSGNGTIVSGPTTSKSNTKTRVHMPNGFFLIISGITQDDDTKNRVQIPCLGGVPFIGAAFSEQQDQDSKRNLMIFIQPRIVDSIEEIQTLTKHQQDIFLYKNELQPMWEQDVEEALEYFNLPQCEWCDEDCCHYCD